MAVPPAPVRVPSQRPLAPSVASVMSVANDKGDNEMIQGAVHRSPGICLTAEESFPYAIIYNTREKFSLEYENANPQWYFSWRDIFIRYQEKNSIRTGIQIFLLKSKTVISQGTSYKSVFIYQFEIYFLHVNVLYSVSNGDRFKYIFNH